MATADEVDDAALRLLSARSSTEAEVFCVAWEAWGVWANGGFEAVATGSLGDEGPQIITALRAVGGEQEADLFAEALELVDGDLDDRMSSRTSEVADRAVILDRRMSELPDFKQHVLGPFLANQLWSGTSGAGTGRQWRGLASGGRPASCSPRSRRVAPPCASGGIPTFLPEILPAVEVGWRLGERHRGRGFATEAGHEWIRYGFEELGLESIVSIYEPENIAPGAVMRRLGFTLARETTHPERGVGLHVMSLSKSAWHSR